MQGIILDEGEDCFVKLNKYFISLNHFEKDYNWLITNIECYPQVKENIQILNHKEYCWLKGEQFYQIVQEDFQWIWGVMSGFDKSIRLEQVLEYQLPFANQNTNLWKNPVTLQNPLATHEIIAWDSRLMIFKSKEANLIQEFIKKFPKSKDLSLYITKAD